MTQALTTDALIQYNGNYYTGADIKAMREWISSCQWRDLDQKAINNLSDIGVLSGVDRTFCGGLYEFMKNMI